MALTARLNLRQAQSLTMTPQLLQSIKLLQFTQLELEQFVDSQVEINPLIERVIPADERFADRDTASSGEPADAETANWDSVDLEVSATAIADKLDVSLENVFPDDPGRTDIEGVGANAREKASVNAGVSTNSVGVGDDYSLEEMAGTQLSLRDVINEQIPFICSTIVERAVAEELLDVLDERGYVEFDDIALAERLGCTPDDIAGVLVGLQTCDPAGVFARDLGECLALQCARNNRLDPAMQTLLDNLTLLARRDFKTLSQLCGVDQSDLFDMFEEIKRLNPRPGFAYELSGSEAIVHDVEVTQAPDGTWAIELNNDALPRIIIDRHYYAEVSRSGLKKEEKTFIADCMASATWLEKSLDQRAITILKVATEIVRQQDTFFIQGVSGLKPMTMKQIADAIKMHESTVSRVASNKFMLTPRGMFEFRYFFTVGINNTDGSSDGHSSEAVRQQIKSLISGETIDNVLSDDTLVALLKKDGVDIARRTVAKYRETMDIPSSVKRRREKKAQVNVSSF